MLGLLLQSQQDAKDVGIRLREVRKHRMLTLKRVGMEAGISAVNLNNVEGGKRRYPRLDFVLTLCRYYGISYTSLFDR